MHGFQQPDHFVPSRMCQHAAGRRGNGYARPTVHGFFENRRAGTIHQPDCPLSCRRCTVASATPGKSLWLQNLGCTFPWRCGIDNVSIQGMCTPPIGRRPKRTDGLQSPPCVPTPNNCAASVNGPQRLPSIHFPRGLFDRGDDAKCLRAPGDKTDRLSVSAFRH